MRVTVKRGPTTTIYPDGAVEVEHPTESDQKEAQGKFDDGQVSKAIAHFETNRDLEPLIVLLSEANPAILRDKKALDLIELAARGNLKRGSGRVVTAETLKRTHSIQAAAHWLKKLGIPLKNEADKNRDGDTQKPSVCRLIGDQINISEAGIYSIIRNSDYEAKNELEILPWKIKGLGLELDVDLILKTYFPRELTLTDEDYDFLAQEVERRQARRVK